MHDGDIARDFGSARERGKTGDVFSRYFQERIGIRRNAKMRRCDFRGVSVMKLNMCCVRPKSTWHAAHHDPQGLRSHRRVAAAAAAGRSPSHRSAAAPPLPPVLDARDRSSPPPAVAATTSPSGAGRPAMPAASRRRTALSLLPAVRTLNPSESASAHPPPSLAPVRGGDVGGAGAVAWLSGA
jgi:hypothetical protein